MEKLLIEKCIYGMKTGDFSGFVKHLTRDAVLVADRGGKVRAALHPIFARTKIVYFLNELFSKGYFQGGISVVPVNGGLGILIAELGVANTVLCFGFSSELGEIHHIFSIRNPDKLEKIMI